MDRWGLYELLKENKITQEAIKNVEKMSYRELLEGVVEYLLIKLR